MRFFVLRFFRFVFAISAATLPLITIADVPSPTLNAKAFELRDFNSGIVLAEQDAHARLEPASLTKLMTAYLTFEAVQQGRFSLTKNLAVSDKARHVEGSRMFIESKTPVSVDELLHGLVIQSGNDSAITLAEGIAGSEEQFAVMMNQKAQNLGMLHTHFMNATGLPHAEHYTTAHDLSTLAIALIKNFPQDYKRLYSIKEYTYNKIRQKNRNLLLWRDASVDGVKTGHTDAAGYCLIASAQRQQFRLISVVLGASSKNARAIESQKLLNYGYQFFESQLAYQTGKIITTTPIWKGEQTTLGLTVAKPVFFVLPRGEYANLRVQMRLHKPLVAPVKIHQAVGTLEFISKGKVIRTEPIVAAQAINEGNIFVRLVDHMRMYLQ